MATNLDAMMRKIAGLIANADNPATTPEAAKTYRAKAEELLLKYRLEEADLIAEDPTKVVPIFKKIQVTLNGVEFINEHYWLWTRTARHCGIRFVMKWERDGARYGYVAHVVGYDVDVRLAELIFNSAILVFGQCLEPEVRPELSDAENVYALRSAGIPRNKIANMLWGASLGSDGAPAHGKVGKLYKEECARRGEDPRVSGRTVNHATYRKAYANAFVDQFSYRLWEARQASDSATGAMVLKDRESRLDEAFYGRFPDQRPKPESEQPAPSSAETKTTKTRAVSKASLARYDRLYESDAALAATSAAKTAVSKIRLDRAGSANRIEEGSGMEIEG